MVRKAKILFILSLYSLSLISQDDNIELLFSQTTDQYKKLELSNKIASQATDPAKVIQYAGIASQLADDQRDTLAQVKSVYYLGRAHRRQGINKKAITYQKEAYQLAQSINNNKWKLNTLRELAKALNNDGQFKSAIPFIKKIILLSTTDNKQHRNAYNLMGVSFNRLSLFDSSLVYLEEAYTLGIENNDSSFIASTYINMGVAYSKMGKHYKALEVYEKAANIMEEFSDQHGLSSCYTNMGNVYKKLGDIDQAMGFHKKSLNLKLQIHDIEGSGRTHNNIANILSRKKKYDEALVHYHKAYEFHLSSGYRRSQALTLANMAEAYMLSEQYDKALQYAYQALEIFQEINNKSGRSFTLETLAKTYLKIQNSPDDIVGNKYGKKSISEIEVMLLKAKDLTEGSKELNSLIDTYYTLTEFYRDQNDTEKAFFYQDKYIAIKDSVYSIDKLSAIAKIQGRLNTESKIKENIFLRENNLLIKSRNRTFLLVAFVLSILLIAAVLFFLKLRTANKQLAVQNQTIESQNLALTKLNETKDRFFGIIAHDLKSPLIALQGLGNRIEFLLQRDDRVQLNEIGFQVDQTATKLNDLLDNLLGWASVQTGNIPYQPTVINLLDLSEEVTLLFSNLIKVNKLNINNKIKPNTTVFADERALNTIFRNLISNAIKFTPTNGNITLACSGNDDQVFVVVKDDGLGIPSRRMEKLFSTEKISSPGARGDKGTGLGLLLCKELVGVNKGTISVDSKEGSWTIFTFSIPKAKQ